VINFPHQHKKPKTKEEQKMKLKSMITTVMCLALTVTVATAQENKDKKPAPKESGESHSHFTKIPATADEIWVAIRKQQGKLATTVEKKDLGEAHDFAFAIRDLVKALPQKLPAEQKAAAEKSAKDIAGIAAEIDKAGAAGAQKATEAGVKKMNAAVEALEKKFKTKPSK
jgi:hypothetical protein